MTAIETSIIIPAFNEAELIAKTLENLLAIIADDTEVIVVDNNSTDQTAAIAAQFSVRVVHEKINQISRARNTGARAALGQYLIFVDADTLPSRELLSEALRLLENPGVVGGGVLLAFDQPVNFIAGTALRLFNRLSRTVKVAAGCFIFCERKAFEEVDGFSEKVYAGEEAWFSLAMKRYAKRNDQKFVIIKAPRIVTSARKAQLYSKGKLLLLILSFVFLPFITRYRGLCQFWYKQRETKE